MKQLILLLFIAGLSTSCIKKNETTSTEIENAEQDVKDIRRDAAEEKVPADSAAGNKSKQVDPLEGQKSQY